MRDDTNGVYWSGGLGMLGDVAGGDVYQGSVFAQGTGYWFGIGLLLDGAGDDQYDALWYTQGSAAHAGIGVLWDGAGDDRYSQMWAPKSGNDGTGHDFGEGFFVDLAGNDVMTGGGLSLGEGNDNGLGPARRRGRQRHVRRHDRDGHARHVRHRRTDVPDLRLLRQGEHRGRRRRRGHLPRRPTAPAPPGATRRRTTPARSSVRVPTRPMDWWSFPPPSTPGRASSAS